MKSKENVSYAQPHLENLNQLCENATTSHNMLILLLPDDEQNKQNEWFASIMKYSDSFEEDVKKWLGDSEEPQQNNLGQSDSAAISEGVLLSHRRGTSSTNFS